MNNISQTMTPTTPGLYLCQVQDNRPFLAPIKMEGDILTVNVEGHEVYLSDLQDCRWWGPINPEGLS